MPTDVADADQVEAAAAAVEAALRADRRVGQRRDGNRLRAASSTPSPTEFKRATEVTYLGAVYGTMAALKRMSARDRGTIVQVGSALAYRAIPLQAAYCGAKFAIRGFTDSIRTELLADRSRVRITMVQLPGVNTTAVQLVPLQAARSSAAGAADLPARDPRRSRLLGRPAPPPRALGRLQRACKAILGNKLAPALADRYLARTAITRPAGRRTCRSPATAPTTSSSPSPGKAATHGIFDAQATTRSPQLWATTHRRAVAGALAAGALRRRSARCARCDERAASPVGSPTPHVLREYALLADGERGILVGPRGDFAWMCFPRWDSRRRLLLADRRRGQLRRHPAGTVRVGRLLRAGQR